MPMVCDMLQEMTGLVPDHSVNPDEAVARGAALYASHLLSKGLGGGEVYEAAQVDFEVTNVNSHSLGVAGIDAETLRETNIILIPRNTPLPAKRTERFTTKLAGQSSIVVQVLEGESSMPGQCTAIGRTVIRDLPPDLPKGWPIEVTFEYSVGGRLKVKAVVPGTHSQMSLTLERAVGLSSARMDHWKQAVGKAAGSSTFEAIAAEEPIEPEIVEDQVAETQIAETQISETQIAETPPSQPEELPPPALPARSKQWKIPLWTVSLVGYVVSAVVGLGIGYLVLSFLRPEDFPLPW